MHYDELQANMEIYNSLFTKCLIITIVRCNDDRSNLVNPRSEKSIKFQYSKLWDFVADDESIDIFLRYHMSRAVGETKSEK